jgi:hypothetical protein
MLTSTTSNMAGPAPPSPENIAIITEFHIIAKISERITFFAMAEQGTHVAHCPRGLSGSRESGKVMSHMQPSWHIFAEVPLKLTRYLLSEDG